MDTAEKVKEITPRMSGHDIKKALKKGGNIHFQAGRYRIKSFLILKSNTKVTCDEGAIFERGHWFGILTTAFTSKTQFYQGEHDITWTGGTFVGDTIQTDGNMIHIFHAQKIIFRNCTFTNCKNGHFVDIVGSKLVYFINCTFQNHILTLKNQDWQAIMIDFAKKTPRRVGTGFERMYDGEHCTNIVFDGCTFKHTRNCIEMTVSVGKFPCGKQHSNIIIQKCEIIGQNIGKGIGVHIVNVISATVRECHIDGFEYGVLIEKSKEGIDPRGVPGKVDDWKRTERVLIQETKFTRCLDDVFFK